MSKKSDNEVLKNSAATFVVQMAVVSAKAREVFVDMTTNDPADTFDSVATVSTMMKDEAVEARLTQSSGDALRDTFAIQVMYVIMGALARTWEKISLRGGEWPKGDELEKIRSDALDDILSSLEKRTAKLVRDVEQDPESIKRDAAKWAKEHGVELFGDSLSVRPAQFKI